MRAAGKTYGDRQAESGNLQPGFRFDPNENGSAVLSIEKVDGGMVTSVTREEFPRHALLLARNARVRSRGIGRRPGSAQYIAKPDSNPVTKIISLFTMDKDLAVIRVTPSSVHVARSRDQWLSFTHPFTGKSLRLSVSQMMDYVFIADGEDELSYVDLITRSVKRIGGSARGRFTTSFGDRILVASLRDKIGGISPSGLAWSASVNPFDWTSLSAGRENLPNNDEITGLFGLEREAVVLRERSIWHATRQPYATAPFRFTYIISQGCDLPYTAAQGEDGVFFADQRTNGVYFYQPGARPQRISDSVRDDLLRDLKNLYWAEGAFDPFAGEYHLGISTTPGSNWLTKFWVFNVRKNAWTFDDGPTASTVGAFSFPGNRVTINELSGTVNALTGTIDTLSPTSLPRPAHFKGLPTGEVILFSHDYDTDWNGSAFEMEAVSGDMGSASNNRTMQELAVLFDATRSGQLILERSKDRVNWKHTKVRATVAGEGQSLKLAQTKGLSGKHLFWRARSNSSDVILTGYWVRLMENRVE